MTGARLDHGTGVFDLQQTDREEIPQMVGSQRVCKRHFQGYSKRSEWIMMIRDTGNTLTS
jgi:hypothetical protein